MIRIFISILFIVNQILRFLNRCWDITDVGIFSLVSSCSKLVTLELVGIVRLTNDGIEGIQDKLPRLIRYERYHQDIYVRVYIYNCVRYV